MRNIINLSLFLVAISCSNEPKTISGWELVWNDEFNRGKIDPSKWIFDIGTGAPVFEAFEPSSPEFVPQNFPKDNFSVRWSGTLTPDHKCEFTLYSIADDGIKIYLDNTNIIDDNDIYDPVNLISFAQLEDENTYFVALSPSESLKQIEHLFLIFLMIF